MAPDAIRGSRARPRVSGVLGLLLCKCARQTCHVDRGSLRVRSLANLIVGTIIISLVRFIGPPVGVPPRKYYCMSAITVSTTIPFLIFDTHNSCKRRDTPSLAATYTLLTPTTSLRLQTLSLVTLSRPSLSFSQSIHLGLSHTIFFYQKGGRAAIYLGVQVHA